MSERPGIGTLAAGSALGLLLLVGVLAGAAASALTGLLGGSAGPGPAPSQRAVTAIPAGYLALYQAAAATCPGLPWTVLAAIGTVESDNGQSNAPGVHSGLNFAGVAMGPLQLEAATFAAYARPVPPGGVNPPSPYDPTDAIYAAARDLCANGARNGADLPKAVLAYNHAEWYVREVLALAVTYGQTPPAATDTALPLPVRYLNDPSVDQGVDYAAPAGTPLYAVGAGVIIREGVAGFGLNTPVLNITAGPLAGRTVYYGHAGPDLVPLGAHVAAGQQISEVGAGIVGISTGPHLEIGFYPPGPPRAGTAMLAYLDAALHG